MYNKVLTGILIILLIAIAISVGYLGYGYYRKITLNADAEKFLDEQFDTIVVQVSEETEQPEEPEEPEQPAQPVEPEQPGNTGNTNNNSTGDSTNASKTNELYYKGYKVVGKLEMPTINIRYPILGENDKAKAIEVSILKIYGPEINTPGNVIIAGHNYNNGLFFGKNKKLNIGDKIYLTDMTGKKVEYTIYDKYYTPEDDYSYITKSTEGKTEVTLYTCDATGANRLIICARAD